MEIVIVTQFRTPALVILVNIFIICGPVTALETNDSNIRQSQSDKPLEEVVVTAPQLLVSLRSRIQNAEEQIYSKYNDINKIDDYDIKCKKSAKIGSHIREQKCEPAFFRNIVAEDAQYAMSQDDLSSIRSNTRLVSQYSKKIDAFRENIIRVARGSPELEKSLRSLHRLKETYKTKRQKCMKKPSLLSKLRC